jgi:glycine oxidase
MEALNTSSSVAILGAGLMGRLLACTLAKKGCAVSLFDAGGPDAEGSAARVAAAMLAPLAESAVTEHSVVRMGQHALTRWPELIAQLAEPVFFQREGTLILWHRQDAPEAARLTRQLRATQAALPDLPPAEAGRCSSHRAAGAKPGDPLWPGPFPAGRRPARQPRAARCDGPHAAANRRAPALAQPACAESFSTTEDQWVFDCRGLGARPQWPALRGVRGEVIRVFAPEVKLTRPTRLVHPRYPLYIAPKPDDVYVIGATEIESDDLSPASVRSTLELLSAAYSLHSGFAEARILEIATQCRPALPDNLPAVQRLAPRVLQINGLYRHGFLIAPALLDVVIELAETGDSPLARTLRPARFPARGNQAA